MKDLTKEISSQIDLYIKDINDREYMAQQLHKAIITATTDKFFIDTLLNEGEEKAVKVAHKLIERELYKNVVASMEICEAYATNEKFRKWFNEYVYISTSKALAR